MAEVFTKSRRLTGFFMAGFRCCVHPEAPKATETHVSPDFNLNFLGLFDDKLELPRQLGAPGERLADKAVRAPLAAADPRCVPLKLLVINFSCVRVSP